MTAPDTAASLAVHRSRKLIPDFRLHRPRSAPEAVAMKAAAGPGAVYMAGGIDVVNRMKSGLPVSDVIHLCLVAGPDGIAEVENGLRLGALVTHDRLATSSLAHARLPALAQTWPDVANIRIRCKGTIGVNIVAGDAAYDFALAALAVNARVHFLAEDGTMRIVAAAQPGGDPQDKLLTAITLPSTVRYARLSRWSSASMSSTDRSLAGGSRSAAPILRHWSRASLWPIRCCEPNWRASRTAGATAGAGSRHRPARTICRSSCHLRLSPTHDRSSDAPQFERGRMTNPIEIAVTINGRAHRLALAPRRVLADMLREDLQLLGCKISCDQAVCGACTALVDEMPVTACTTFAFGVHGKAVIAIEGLAKAGALDPVQRAFLKHGAFQCGFCTPGMILSVKALLARHPEPDEALIRQWLSANICRCTGYQMIVEAVRAAARTGPG